MRRLLALSVMVLVVACGGGSVDSSDLKTEGIHGTFRVYGNNNETTIDARLTAGGPNGSDVKLTEGDTFSASAYNETKRLNREPQWLGIYDTYMNQFDSNQSGAEITISLSRANDPDAPQSSVVLPPRFFLSSHYVDDIVTVAADEQVLLQWDKNYSGEIVMYLSLICGSTEVTDEELRFYDQTDLADVGEASFYFENVGDDTSKGLIDTGKACKGEVIIEREALGSIDPNLDGGNIKGYQQAKLEFKVIF